jgi:hypothetical protein
VTRTYALTEALRRLPAVHLRFALHCSVLHAILILMDCSPVTILRTQRGLPQGKCRTRAQCGRRDQPVANRLTTASNDCGPAWPPGHRPGNKSPVIVHDNAGCPDSGGAPLYETPRGSFLHLTHLSHGAIITLLCLLCQAGRAPSLSAQP